MVQGSSQLWYEATNKSSINLYLFLLALVFYIFSSFFSSFRLSSNERRSISTDIHHTFTTTVHQDMTGNDQRSAALGHLFIFPNAFKFFFWRRKFVKFFFLTRQWCIVHHIVINGRRLRPKNFCLSEKALFFKAKSHFF